MKVRNIVWALLLCLLLSGCRNFVLERSYSSVEPHSESYWENADPGKLRAESYPDLVNALLLLLGDHADDGVVRIYTDEPGAEALAAAACGEVQQETALGAYLLDYITYAGTQEHGYYELAVHFGYRRTAEEQKALINATSTEALPDLLRTAVQQDWDRVAARIGYFSTDRAGVMEAVYQIQQELAPEDGAWQVFFYPDSEDVGIVEVFLFPAPEEEAPETETPEELAGTEEESPSPQP